MDTDKGDEKSIDKDVDREDTPKEDMPITEEIASHSEDITSPKDEEEAPVEEYPQLETKEPELEKDPSSDNQTENIQKKKVI